MNNSKKTTDELLLLANSREHYEKMVEVTEAGFGAEHLDIAWEGGWESGVKSCREWNKEYFLGLLTRLEKAERITREELEEEYFAYLSKNGGCQS